MPTTGAWRAYTAKYTLPQNPTWATGDFGVRTRLDGDMRDALLQIRPTIDLREGTPAAGWHLRAQLYAPDGDARRP